MMHRKIRMCLLCSAFAGGLLALGGVTADAAGYSSAPRALASTGVNPGMLVAGLLLLAFGGLLALILGRKRS